MRKAKTKRYSDWKCKFKSPKCYDSHRCKKCKEQSAKRIKINMQLVILTSDCTACGAKLGDPCIIYGREWDSIHQIRRSRSHKFRTDNPEEWTKLQANYKRIVKQLDSEPSI